MGANGARRTGRLAWLRGLPRSSVLVFCTALFVAVQAILAVFSAASWTRVLVTVVVLAVAAASELDKLSTKRREPAGHGAAGTRSRGGHGGGVAAPGAGLSAAVAR